MLIPPSREPSALSLRCVFAVCKMNRFPHRDAVHILGHKALPKVPQANYSHYRYLVHMPGSATGSYSRNLQYLWSHGSVVLIWRHESLEFYYQVCRSFARVGLPLHNCFQPSTRFPSMLHVVTTTSAYDVSLARTSYCQWLQEGVTHLAVDGDDIAVQIARIEANATLRDMLIKGARTFQRQRLSRAALVDRWWQILSIVRERQAPEAPRPPPGACTCDDQLLAQQAFPECKKCEIVRMKESRIAKFVGVVPKAAPPPGPVVLPH